MEKTYTPAEIESEITEEILADIKKESKIVNYRLTHDKGIFFDYTHHVLRAREVSFKGSKYKNESLIYKNLLAANVAFPDDKKFIEVLNNHGFTVNELNLINDPSISPTNKLKLLYTIAFTLKKYYGSNITTLALNRINEIMVFNPNLLVEKTNKDTQGMTR